ncbi:MAG: extracellular solute-binding protein [Treponema sp.]
MKNITFFLCFSFIFFSSCKKSVEDKIAVIWTNKVEVASYCEMFNTSQNKYQVVVEYKKNPAIEILEEEANPDMVISPRLKGKATRAKFKPLNYLLKEKIDKSSFYNELLDLGLIDGEQYLLPLSFNLPTIIFSLSNKHLLENNFTISFDEIKKIALSFNTKKGDAYTKMCFAPRWENQVLYATMQGLGVDFEEGNSSFVWNDKALKTAVNYLKNWTKDVNETSQKEDEFKFKYLYDVPYILINNGFCAFYYMSTEELFLLPKEKLQNIDFRYLEFDGKVPCNDDILYAGICSNTKNKETCEAFIIWLYSLETQEKLLMQKIKKNLPSKDFGIAGGFSSLKPITEKIFPQHYPLLLAHLPQNSSLKTPRILPNNWETLKTEIVFPYLLEATISHDNVKEERSTLEEKIKEWENSH